MLIRGQIDLFNNLDDYKFEALPKGLVFEISMNAFTGAVFGKIGKQSSCAEIALEVMRKIVYTCDVMQSLGFEKPLEELVNGKGSCLAGTKAVNIKVLDFGKRGDVRKNTQRFGYGMKLKAVS